MNSSALMLACVIAVLAMCAEPILAQAGKSDTVSSRPIIIHEGKITVAPSGNDRIPSLIQLITVSHLIIEGTILSISPPVRRNEEIPDSIETHSMVAIHSILSGSIPDGSKTIVLAEEGGTIDRLEVSLDGSAPVKTGDRYILFLSPDTRKAPENNTGSPRYHIVGSLTGKIKIEGQKIQISPLVAAQLRQYNGMDTGSFLRALDNLIHHRSIPTKRNTIPHPGLPDKRDN
ncbi:hypothetical protein [Bryobacter aggregatus]|uniref:hypothetical protein n=1 Tax=Bryobacter aggregatus TaxID=360054 RepID=UPI0012BAEB7F|nr:hypothetical protein [Bryobacter aggregatus]